MYKTNVYQNWFILLTLIGNVYTIQYEVTDQVYFKIAIDDQYEGTIVIGLFGKIAPKTVENFIALASGRFEGKSYVGTVFHRIIERFMIQGGDILHNNGSGTWSIYGKTFPDENFIVKHSAAGFVSMANSGPNSNGCQYFITTSSAPWLDGLHVCFGKVVRGQSIVHKIEHLKADWQDRPLVFAKILESGIIETPDSFLVHDQLQYGFLEWLKAGTVPLGFSFTLMIFFHWVIKKLDTFAEKLKIY